MTKDTRIHIPSTCAATLLVFSSGLKLQLLISTQFSINDCLAWAKSLEALSNTNEFVPDTEPILDRPLTEPVYTLNALRQSAIASGIIGYSSTVESYLQNIIGYCLRRNSGLRRKGLSGIQVSALELEEHEDTKIIKQKVIESLSSENSKGALFSNKLKRVSTFLSLTSTGIDPKIIESLDSIWQLRNAFAHENQSSIASYKIKTSNGELILTKGAKQEDYANFILKLVEIIDKSNDCLLFFDGKALDMWGTDKYE